MVSKSIVTFSVFLPFLNFSIKTFCSAPIPPIWKIFLKSLLIAYDFQNILFIYLFIPYLIQFFYLPETQISLDFLIE